MSCSRCGAAIPPGAHFCASCGLDISSPQGGVTTVNVPAAPQRSDALRDALRQATLGDYEILAELGRGGMATVFLAHDIALGRKVAIKVMSPQLFSGEGMAERFKREARTAAQLSHPHIIPIYSVQESGDLLFFVMKFIEGRPLDSIIREVGALPIPMVRTILTQVGGALGYAHKRGVIHRDIKPANIMLDADGWAIVTDFGIAKVSETQGLTVTGATVGTPSYMSPEQCAAQELTGATDQYSLGVVAYEMLSGKLPFIAESVMAVMYAHFNQPPRPVVQVRPDCPMDLAATVMRMLEKDPTQRFPSMEAVTSAVGSVSLSPDDPVRTQMMTLAAAGEGLKLLERFSTPVSQPSVVRSAGGTARRRSSIAVLTIAPSRVSVTVGDAIQLRATPKTREGQTLPGRPVSWASTNPDVAAVSETGLVTATAPGTVTITASSADTSATATITVVASRGRGRTLALLAGGVLLAVIAGLVILHPWRSEARPPGSTPSETLATHIPAAADTVRVPAQSAPPLDTANSGGTPTSSKPLSQTRAPARTATAPQASPPDTSDAKVAMALLDARTTRDHAVSAGATAVDLAAGDAELQVGQDQRQAGHRAEAFDHMRTAANLFVTAESSAAAARLAARRTAPPPDTAPKAAPPSPQPVDPEPAIRAAIGAYAHALEARRLDDLQRAFPDMSPSQTDNWRQFFAGARDVHAIWKATRVSATGNQAEARVSITLTFKTADTHEPNRTDSDQTFYLLQQSGRWIITAVH
ncbi:MAG TPA: protein kinase [Gemmatimonadales bacterium]|nr:protein kinase [Gemmatimonadales bacterium]